MVEPGDPMLRCGGEVIGWEDLASCLLLIFLLRLLVLVLVDEEESESVECEHSLEGAPELGLEVGR